MATLFEFAPTGTITNGAAVPTDPAKYDTRTGDVTYDTAVTFKDLTASAKAVNPDGTALATIDQVLAAAVSTRRLVRVMRVAAFTAGTFTTLTRWRTPDGTALGEVRINSQRKLILRDDVTNLVLATSNASIAAGSTFRFELGIVGTDVRLRLYLDPEGLTPDEEFGPFPYSGGSFDRIVDGVGTAAAQTTVHILYAADGDTENPSLTRWATPPDTATTPGVRRYLVTGTGEVLITAAELDAGTEPPPPPPTGFGVSYGTAWGN